MSRMRSLYHQVYQLIPKGKTRDKLRDFAFDILNSVTLGNKTILLDRKRKIFGKFKNLPLIEYTDCIEDGALEGYTKSYTPEKGDVVIDGGAFQGIFTVYAAKLVGPTGRVIAFEPEKANFKVLKKNIKLNKLKNVILVNRGLWSSQQEMEFKANGGVSRLSVFDKDHGFSKKIRVTDVDSFMKKIKISRVNFVKMDVEGAELEVINGMREIMKNNKIHFAVASYHVVNGEKTSRKLEEMFKKEKYEAFSEYPIHLTTYASKK